MAVEQAKAKTLRVTVTDQDGNEAVNVSMPVGVVKFGMKMARTFSPEVAADDLDWDAIAAMIEEGERGQIVHVEDRVKRQIVDVWVE